jgi:hypothetical protein
MVDSVSNARSKPPDSEMVTLIMALGYYRMAIVQANEMGVLKYGSIEEYK